MLVDDELNEDSVEVEEELNDERVLVDDELAEDKVEVLLLDMDDGLLELALD